MEHEAMLSPYRVLDLTEGGYLLTGRILADFGADVIVIEPPGGSPSRNIGPFYKDIPDPEKSLYWFSLNANKRGITLGIDKADGREIFKRLVKTADLVLESFPPGHMDNLGLGYDGLCEVKPDIILTSITAFGQEGPKAHYKDAELTTWASSALHYIVGDADRPPVWVSWPNARFVGSYRAVGGALFALWHREMTGEGQYVDIPTQQWLSWHTTMGTGFWECLQIDSRREGPQISVIGAFEAQVVFPCKDGYVHTIPMGGAAPAFAPSMEHLSKWMDEEGMAPDWMRDFDWYWDFDMVEFLLNPEKGREMTTKVIEPIAKFTMTKTVAEWRDACIKRDIMGCAVSSTKDLADDPHLKARDFWQEVEHPELGDTLTYCGPVAKLSEAPPMKIVRRAPLIGEHNEEIYEKELGLSRQHLILLKQAGVI